MKIVSMIKESGRLALPATIVIALTSLLMISCGGGGGNGGSDISALTVKLVTCPGSGTTNVIIQDFSFTPANISGPANTIVKWTNNGATHTVTGTTVPANGAFDSSNISTGSSVCFQFTATGTYNYHCSIHPSMTGTVVVQ